MKVHVSWNATETVFHEMLWKKSFNVFFLAFNIVGVKIFAIFTEKESLSNKMAGLKASNLTRKRSSLCYITSTRHERNECDKCATRTTRVKIFDLITTQVKTFSHPYIFTAIWQMKDYKERNNFILRTTFWKCLVPMPKCVWKVYHKNWTL